MVLPVTLTIAAAAALVNLWLALRIVPRRVKGIGIGDGGDPQMTARMRAHANFAEYAPFVVILLGLIEFAGGSPTLLWLIGAAFVLARVAHGFGMERSGANPLRAGGALVTWVVLAGLAGWALAIAYASNGAGTAGEPIEIEAVPRG